MKRKKKLYFNRRILAIFLAMIMCFGEFGVTAFAEGSNEIPEITVDNTSSTENVEDTDNTEDVEDADNAENTDNTEDVEDTDNAENTDNTENVENVDNAENTDNTEDVENVDNAENTDNTEDVENTDNVENVDNTNNVENVDNTDQQTRYTTREELEAAYNTVVGLIDSEDKSALNDAIDNYVSVYDRLSPEDQAGMKEQYDYVISLRFADTDSTDTSDVKEEETKTDEGKALLEQFRSLLDAMEAFVLTEENQEEYAALGMQASKLLEVLLEKYYDYPGMDADMARFQALADKQTEGTEELALIKGEQFTIKVVKVVNGVAVDSVTLTQTCLQTTGHSGYTHSTNLRTLANASGFSGYKGYNWSPYTTVPSTYTNGLCPNSNYTTVNYNITGSAPYRANQTLFLFFESSKTFTLQYDANGGSGAPAEQTATSTASSYNFTISSTKPTRSDYEFLGWSTSRTATSPNYYGGGAINVTGTTTLYAVWKEKEQPQEVTLTYDANGGSNPPDPQTENIGTNVTIKGKEEMTRDDYTFQGWNIDKNATTADWMEGDGMNLRADTTLYAVWKKEAETLYNYNYELTWDYNGGELGGKKNYTESETGLNKSPHTFLVGNDPTRDGYTFDGWTYTHDNIGNGKYDIDNQKVVMTGVTDATVSGTLTAKWVKDSGATYTVTYTWTGLPEDSNEKWPAGDSYEAGDPVILDTNYPEGKELTINGKTYTFTGWKVPDDITVDASGFTMPDKDVEIKGEWKENSDDNNNTTSYRILREYHINGQTVATFDEGERDGSIGSEIDGQRIANGNSSWVNYGGRTFLYGGSNPGTLTLREDKTLNVIKLIYVYNDRNENPNPDPDSNPDPDPDPNPSSDPTPPERRNDTPEQGDDTPEQVPEEEQPSTNVNIEVGFMTPAAPMVNRVIELVEISNEEVPLANVPSTMAEGLADIFDEEVPLSNVPKTGDNFLTWLFAALGSAMGLVLLALKGRKRKGTAA